MKYPVIVLTCIYIYLLGVVVAMSVQTTFHVKKNPNAQEMHNCVPTCKLFPALCKNNGKCRAKNGQDCKWFCECPPNCEGYFCEKVITEANKAGDIAGVQVKVVIEQKKKVDVSSFDKSKLAQALQNIYSKKKSKDEKPPEGPQIERIGKTLMVKETITGTINCPPELVDAKTSNKTVNGTGTGTESATTVPPGGNMHNSNGTTTTGLVSAANETTSTQSTVAKAYEQTTTNGTEAAASTDTTTSTSTAATISSTTTQSYQSGTRSSTDKLITMVAKQENKSLTAYYTNNNNKVKRISKIHESSLRDKDSTSSVNPESTTQIPTTTITTASSETTTMESKINNFTTSLLSATEYSREASVQKQMTAVAKNESTTLGMPSTQQQISTVAQNESTALGMPSTQKQMSSVAQNESTTPGMPSTQQHMSTVAQHESTKSELTTTTPQPSSTVAKTESAQSETTTTTLQLNSTVAQNEIITSRMTSTQLPVSTVAQNESRKSETTYTKLPMLTVAQNESTKSETTFTQQHMSTVAKNESTKSETTTSTSQRMSTAVKNKSTTPETTQQHMSTAAQNKRTTSETMPTLQHTIPGNSRNSMSEASVSTESPTTSTVSQHSATTNKSTNSNDTTLSTDHAATGRTEDSPTTVPSTVTSHENTETIKIVSESTTDRIRESTTTLSQSAQAYPEQNQSKDSMHNSTPSVRPSFEENEIIKGILGKPNTSNDLVNQLLKEVLIVGTNSIPETMNKVEEPKKTATVASTTSSQTAAASGRDSTQTGATTSAETTQTPPRMSTLAEKTDGLSKRKDKINVKIQQVISTMTAQTTANLKTTTNSTQSSKEGFTTSSSAKTTTVSTVPSTTKDLDIIIPKNKMFGIHQKPVDNNFSEAQMQSNQLLDNLKGSKLEAQKSDINNVYGAVYSALSETAENKNNLLADTVMPSS